MESSSYRINSHDNSESDSDDNFLHKSSRNVFSQTGMKRSSENLIDNIPLNSDKNLSNDDNIPSSIQNQEIQTKRKKINNIWSSVIQEQSLSTVFDICNMERKPHFYEDRHCESYDYRRRELDTRPDIDPDSVTIENEETFPIIENIEEETSVPEEKVTSNTLHKQHKLSHKEYKIAKLIVRKLQEKKYKLVFKVVKVLGIRKALELLRKTEHIEKNGGMMVLNKSRRRTAGGVFFHLIKSDHRIPKEQFDEIFGEEENFNLRKNMYKDFENQNKISKFHVLCCYSCKIYQVHPMKKSNQWNCKVCYEKQSVKQVCFQGTAVECREHTQKLNLLNRKMDSVKENEMELVTEIKNEISNNPQIPSTSKWTEFLPKNEQEKMDDDIDLTSIQENQSIRKDDDIVFQDQQESVCNKSEAFSIDDEEDGEIKSVLNSDNSITSKWNEFI